MFYQFATLADMAAFSTQPPAMAYVHETSSYFLYYSTPPHYKTLRYMSAIGEGWHPIEASAPSFDRPIHNVHTRWLNGHDLDYYPDFVWTLQSTSYLEWEDLFRVHGEMFGPPSDAYDTVIGNIAPGDLILRHEEAVGVLPEGGMSGSWLLEVEGLERELSTKFGAAWAAEVANNTKGQSGCTMILPSGAELPLISHAPNNFDTPDSYENAKSPWRPSGVPTTAVQLLAPLAADIAPGTEVRFRTVHWYAASVEILGGCMGHLPHCFPYFRIAGADAAPRFRRLCHTAVGEAGFNSLLAQKKCVPGDIVYDPTNNNWSVATINSAGDLSSVPTVRLLSVRNPAAYAVLKQFFHFEHMFVLNREHSKQSYLPAVPGGVSPNGIIRYTAAERTYHPAEWCYIGRRT